MSVEYLKLEICDGNRETLTGFLKMLDLKNVVTITAMRCNNGKLNVRIETFDARYPSINVKGDVFDIGSNNEGAWCFYNIMQETSIPKEQLERIFSPECKNFFSAHI